MIIEELVSKVSEISRETEYWFVRTDSGKYFDTFTNNGFIGIGWNQITLDELLNSQKDVVKEKIARIEELDPQDQNSKGNITAIYNKLLNFINLRKGDIVIIPSHSSNYFAFGEVSDSLTYIENDNLADCEFRKRKKIRWITKKAIGDLDPTFHKIKISRHTISSVKDYSRYIDNVISNLYIKEDNTHFVLDIKTQREINVKSLLKLVEGIQDLVESIDVHFQLNEEIDYNAIRLNLQSPGKIEFKLQVGKSLIILAAVLSLTCCDSSSANIQHKEELENIIEINNDTLQSIKNVMDELEVDRQKINSF
ncbi:hypothetical protein AAG747_14205 [Rapidithrix thailandica]|uniref:Uncharacterized protein n=1 Tax=Rapidithrix thailandica TaxID=413964 RepID=A0AAW9SDX7_9BACT